MEGGIEYGNLRGVGHQFLAGTDTGNVGRLMQGSHIAQIFDLFQHFIGNHNGFVEDFTAVHLTVAHCIDFIHGFDDTVVGVNQSSQDFLDAVHMVGDGAFQSYFVLAGGGVGQNGTFDADTFYQTFCDDRFILHINQLIFDGRAAAVYNKNLHYIAS